MHGISQQSRHSAMFQLGSRAPGLAGWRVAVKEGQIGRGRARWGIRGSTRLAWICIVDSLTRVSSYSLYKKSDCNNSQARDLMERIVVLWLRGKSLSQSAPTDPSLCPRTPLNSYYAYLFPHSKLSFHHEYILRDRCSCDWFISKWISGQRLPGRLQLTLNLLFHISGTLLCY